jgi:hypothetical protein
MKHSLIIGVIAGVLITSLFSCQKTEIEALGINDQLGAEERISTCEPTIHESDESIRDRKKITEDEIDIIVKEVSDGDDESDDDDVNAN